MKRRLPRFRFRGIRLKIHLLSALLFLITIVLSGAGEAFSVLFALLLHEAGHLLAAKAVDIEPESLEVMPFGAAIRLRNPYSEEPHRLLLLSAAGPAASLAAALVFRFVGQAELAKANMLIGAFNMIPALPLDGGRMLYGTLASVIGRRRVAEAGIRMGQALGLFLGLITFSGVITAGRLNLTIAISSIFLLASVGKEKEALREARIHGLLEKLQPKTKPLRIRAFAVDAKTPPHEALTLCSPGEADLFVIYDNGTYKETMDAGELLRRAAGENVESIGELTVTTCANREKRV